MKIGPVIVLSVLGLLLTVGCAAKMKRTVLNEPYRSADISTVLTITGIDVVDGRTGVDTGTLVVQRSLFKKISEKITPRLTEENVKVIKDEIAHYASGGKTAVRVKATVKTGSKEYTNGTFNSREYAEASVNVELLDTLHNTQLFATTGEASYEVKSIRADTAFLESLYRKALKTCVYKAFESIKDFMANRAKEEPALTGTKTGLGQ